MPAQEREESRFQASFNFGCEKMKEYVNAHPRSTASQIQIELMKVGRASNIKHIENELYNVTNKLSPKDNQIAFTSDYCLSEDGTQNLFKLYSKIPFSLEPPIQLPRTKKTQLWQFWQQIFNSRNLQKVSNGFWMEPFGQLRKDLSKWLIPRNLASIFAVAISS